MKDSHSDDKDKKTKKKQEPSLTLDLDLRVGAKMIHLQYIKALKNLSL